MRGANFLALGLIIFAFVLFDMAARGSAYATLQALKVPYQGSRSTK